jgi:methylmalonyl-CoA mutase N-terminal domain/subunit
VFRVDESVGLRQAQRLEALRELRDEKRHAAVIERIKDTAKGDENLMPILLDAVKAQATLGEISNALRLVWGEHTG